MARARFPYAAVLLLLASLGAGPVEAQVIRGRLLDHSSESPVTTATVLLLDATGAEAYQVVTDADGQFTIPAPGPGRYELRAERIGYETVTSQPVRLQRADTVQVDLHIATDAVPLAPLTVTAATRAPLRNRRLDDFFQRQRRGLGTFLGPDDIEQLRMHNVPTLLRQVPTLTVHYNRTGSVATMRGRFGGDCVPMTIVDGHRFQAALDELVPGGIALRAVEVYRPQQVPAEFASVNMGCGVIVIWTEMSVGGD